MDLPVRHARQQHRNDAPAVAHRFEFGRGAEVFEEGADLGGVLQGGQRLRQAVDGGLGVVFGEGAGALFQRIAALMY